MRVLVVDQDSASNLAITRSLRDLYTVDCVTNKGDCLDLLRANTFEVIVATERLEDGSGLELLGQISKKWPSLLRIFAADRQRLQLLRGRLGPFELFQTLSYPIDPQRLMAALELAGAGQHPDADTPDTQQVESSGEVPAEAGEAASELNEPLRLEQSDEFSEPRFARAGRSEPARAASGSGGVRSSARGGSPSQARAAPAQRPRVSSAPSSGRAAGANAPRGAGRSNPSRSRRAEAVNSDLAAKFPGSGTIGQRRPPVAPTGASQNTRPRAATNKAPPVRFPPLERTPPLERIPPLETPDAATRRSGEFSEAAAMARAARSNYEATSDEFDTKRLATLIGGGVAIVAVVVFLGFKMFGSRSEAPKATAPVVTHTPEYPPQVTALVAETEAAFKADDFKTARADVDKLRQLSPSHPRLDFFQGLLLARADAAGKSNTASGGRGAAKKGGKSSVSGGMSPSDAANGGNAAGLASARAAGASAVGAASSSNVRAAGSGGAVGAAGLQNGASSAATAAPSTASSTADSEPPGSTLLPPETPVGITRPRTAASSDTGPTSAPPSGPVGSASATTGAAAAAPSATSSGATTAEMASAPPAAEAPHAPAATAPPARRAAGEPPPVIQEAKLIRRVNPDYPSAAKKDGIAGSVDLNVTVSSQGVVEDVTVVQATPPDMFDKSAVAAVRKWKYDPRFVDGLPSQSHLKVHLDFGPNK